MKDLVREKKLAVWNEIVEKVNVDFDGSRKEFWAFVGSRTKCKKRNISSLKNEAGVSVTSTKGKLEALQNQYERLGRVSIDSAFDSNWKELVERKVSMCGSLSKVFEDEALDRGIEKAKRMKCICKLKKINNKTGGSDGLVGDLLKYGSSGMVYLLEHLFRVVWHEEVVPKECREGLIVNLFKKGDKEEPGNYMSITLLSVVGKVF